MNLNEWKKEFFKYYHLESRKVIGIEIDERFRRIVLEAIGVIDKISYAFLVIKKCSTMYGPAIINLAGTLSREQEEILLNSCEVVITTDKGLAAYLTENDRKVLFLFEGVRYDAFKLMYSIREITEYGVYKKPVIPVDIPKATSFQNRCTEPEVSGIQSAKVGIVMPLYNHEKYVEESVRSIIGQTFSDWRLYIINDASTDSSREIVDNIFDKRIVCINHMKNKGIAAALNTGFKLAKEPYLTWISSDNVYYDKFLYTLTEFMTRQTSAGFVYSDYDLIDDKGKLIRTVYNPLYEELKLRDCYEMGICFMFTKRIKNTVGEYREGFAQDYDMAIRMSQHGSFHHISEVLGAFRDHPNQLSKVDNVFDDTAKAKEEAKKIIKEYR